MLNSDVRRGARVVFNWRRAARGRANP